MDRSYFFFMIGVLVGVQTCIVIVVVLFTAKYYEWKKTLKDRLDKEEAKIRKERGL